MKSNICLWIAGEKELRTWNDMPSEWLLILLYFSIHITFWRQKLELSEELKHLILDMFFSWPWSAVETDVRMHHMVDAHYCDIHMNTRLTASSHFVIAFPWDQLPINSISGTATAVLNSHAATQEWTLCSTRTLMFDTPCHVSVFICLGIDVKESIWSCTCENIDWSTYKGNNRFSL